MPDSPSTGSMHRRTALSAIATGVATLSGGCVRRMRSVAGWESAEQVSLDIKTVPADADPYALRIARQIAEWYRAAGIDAGVTPMAWTELLRQVLIQNQFDLFVCRLPGRFRNPNALYPLLHSRFSESAGWQNPFGYANLDVDDALETLRRSDVDERSEDVASLLQTVARTQPFSVIGFPDDIRAARRDAYTNWRTGDLRSAQGYLALDGVGRATEVGSVTEVATDTPDDTGAANDTDATDDADVPADTETPDKDRILRMAVTDRRPTENLNPLAVEFRSDDPFVGFLYDSLGYWGESGQVEPWMADSWALSEDGGTPRATVRLRSDLEWHDGEAITADDVEFTHALLADTTMGEGDGEEDTQVPAPRFQGRNTLIDDVRAVSEEAVEFHFRECTPETATAAFTIPILPEHVWEDRTGRASVSGIEVGVATEAIVSDNVPPVGSGPLEFVRNTPRERLVLDRYDDHFLTRDPTGIPADLAGGPEFDRLSVTVAGSDVSAVELVANGDADMTGTTVGADTVPRIGRSKDLELLVERSNSPFVVGYNSRRPPLTNPRFRNTLSRLIDQSYLVREVFDGYAQPAVSPLSGTRWLPSDLRWDGENPVTPFLGSNGMLDRRRAEEAFREAGYQYTGDRLVEGG